MISSTSIPRAATSVQTNTRTWRLRKACITKSRCCWLKSPCNAAAVYPSAISFSAISCVSILVLQKTIPYIPGALSSNRRIPIYLLSRVTLYTLCSIWAVAWFLFPTCTVTGDSINSRVMRWIASGMVAEKSQMFTSGGERRNTSRISSTNPIWSISSASSKTNVCNSERVITPLLYKSINRPGVATTISTPCFNALICVEILEPP